RALPYSKSARKKYFSRREKPRKTPAPIIQGFCLIMIFNAWPDFETNIAREFMKNKQFVTYLIILVFTGLFSCANPTSPSNSQYAVTLSGTVVNLIGTQLDSVTMV